MAKSVGSKLGYNRATVFLTAVFVVAMALSVAWQWAQARRLPGHAPASGSPMQGAASSPGTPDDAAVPSAELGRPVTAGATDASAGSMESTLSVANADQQRELLTVAAIGKKVGARTKAVFKLRDFGTREVTDALASISTNDESSQVRSTAVQSLLHIAMESTDADGVVRSALRPAMNDRDPDVAADAKAAYDKIESLQSAQ